jgi:methylglyoxal synthase
MSRPLRLTVALIAQDATKPILAAWAVRHRALLAPHDILATATTGAVLREHCPELSVETVLSGPRGGDLQIGARVAEGRVDAIVFLFDPLVSQPHEPDARALIRVAALRDVPIAVNLATAEMLAGAIETLARARQGSY